MYLENDRPTATSKANAALLAGGLIGLGIAVLLAPCSGAETRGRIASSTRNLAARFRGTMGEIDASIRRFTESVDAQLTRVERLMRAVQNEPEPAAPPGQAWERSTVQ